jgi:hemoglobin-like flavoprotein
MTATTEDTIMDSRQISMVKESFEKVKPFSNRLTRVLYDQLFELNPDLRKLFKKDMREQRRKFIKALTFIVENLHDANIIGPKIKEIAIAHVSLGVKKEDYQTFGNALIFALSAALGDDFTPAVKAAWKASYNTLTRIMIAEAYK